MSLGPFLLNEQTITRNKSRHRYKILKFEFLDFFAEKLRSFKHCSTTEEPPSDVPGAEGGHPETIPQTARLRERNAEIEE